MERSPERIEKVKRIVANKQEGIIVLEDIHDPHNAQAVIRSCECFGFHHVYLIFDKEKSFNPSKMGKLASSSANKWLDYKFFTSTAECYSELKKNNYSIFATLLDNNARSIHDFDFTQEKKIALVFGNEHAGISEYAAKNSDHSVYIPMQGMIQSLNLSVTAAVCMYEVSRQRIKNYTDFNFDNKTQQELFEDLIKR
jgi:tRNA (guanosine-2'-O-)-methyltransferase